MLKYTEIIIFIRTNFGQTNQKPNKSITKNQRDITELGRLSVSKTLKLED